MFDLQNNSNSRKNGKVIKKVIEKIKKKVDIPNKLVYTEQVLSECSESRKWFVGQAVKTPPSHGGNRGSIPLRTVSHE